MRQKALSGQPLRTYVLVFDPGEDPIPGLTSFAADSSIGAAHLTAVGGFSSAVVGWFDLEMQDYRRIRVDEQVEVLSLVGDVTLPPPGGSKPKVHCHIVLGRRDGSTVGGHLLEGHVRPTLEVMLTETPAELHRRHDPATGLSLIDPARSTAVDRPAEAAGSRR